MNTTTTPRLDLAEALENPIPGAYYWSGVLHTGRDDFPEVSVGGIVGLIRQGASMGLLGEALALSGRHQPGGIVSHLGDERHSGVDWRDQIGALDDETADEIAEIAEELVPRGTIEEMFAEAVAEAVAAAYWSNDEWVLIAIGSVLVIGADGEEWDYSPTPAELEARGVPHANAVMLAALDGDAETIWKETYYCRRIAGSSDYDGGE